MQISSSIINLSALVTTSIAVAVLQDTITLMIPWLMAITTVVAADLVVGLRKSLKLDIHISVSLAGRETLGKLVVYAAVVLMFAMVDVASGRDLSISKVGCLFVCGLEITSIIGNLLKPYGVDISLKSVIKAMLKMTGKVDADDAAEIVGDDPVDVIRERERGRWERRHR